MENKDYIYIYDEKGKKTKMELVLAINSEDGENQYIVYKDVNKVIPLYMAKIKLNKGLMDLNTDLTAQEKELVERKLKEKVIGGKNV